jgi:hypothetical protein
MNVVNPQDTDHQIDFIPRFYPSDEIVINLFNEGKQTTETIENTYTITDGQMIVAFEYDFIEGERFQIKITEGVNVVYRGRLFATTQDPQNYNPTANAYYY